MRSNNNLKVSNLWLIICLISI